MTLLPVAMPQRMLARGQRKGVSEGEKAGLRERDRVGQSPEVAAKILRLLLPCPVLLLQRLSGAVRYKEAMEAGAETEEEEGAVKAATVQQGLREQAPRHACV